jgi:hypothetical protein
MTSMETTAILAVIRTAYPRYYDKKTEKELKETISLWHTMLAEYRADTVSAAVKALIATSKFPPTIAEVIEMINTLTKPAELGEVEAWGLVKNAIRNSTYHSVEEFDKLPKTIQRTLGNPSVLREWAISEDESMENVIASNFMRAYRAKVDNVRTLEAVPASVKAMVIETAERLKIGG